MSVCERQAGSAWLVVIFCTAVLSVLALGVAWVLRAERELGAADLRARNSIDDGASARSLAASAMLEGDTDEERVEVEWPMQAPSGTRVELGLRPLGEDVWLPIAGFEWEGPLALALSRRSWEVTSSRPRPRWMPGLEPSSRQRILLQTGPMALAGCGGGCTAEASRDAGDTESPPTPAGVWLSPWRITYAGVEGTLRIDDLENGGSQNLGAFEDLLAGPIELGPSAEARARWLVATRSEVLSVVMRPSGTPELVGVLSTDGCTFEGRVSVALLPTVAVPLVVFATAADASIEHCRLASLGWFQLGEGRPGAIRDFRAAQIDEAADPVDCSAGCRFPLEAGEEFVSGPWFVAGTIAWASADLDGQPSLRGLELSTDGGSVAGLWGFSPGAEVVALQLIERSERDSAAPAPGLPSEVSQGLLELARQALPRRCLSLQPRWSVAAALADGSQFGLFDLPLCAESLLKVIEN